MSEKLTRLLHNAEFKFKFSLEQSGYGADGRLKDRATKAHHAAVFDLGLEIVSLERELEETRRSTEACADAAEASVVPCASCGTIDIHPRAGCSIYRTVDPGPDEEWSDHLETFLQESLHKGVSEKHKPKSRAIPRALKQTAMRIGWNARKARLVESLNRDVRIAAELATGRHKAVRLLAASMVWAHEGRGTYDEFKEWRKNTMSLAKAEEQRLSARLQQVRSMINPYKED